MLMHQLPGGLCLGTVSLGGTWASMRSWREDPHVPVLVPSVGEEKGLLFTCAHGKKPLLTRQDRAAQPTKFAGILITES